MTDSPREPGPEGRSPAEEHYYQGNRLFEAGQWANAAEQWRRAGRLWGPRAFGAEKKRRRLVQLRAALALVATAFLVHQLLFVFFPRDPIDLILLDGDQRQSRSWLERWLDNGRPQESESHKMSFREWWSRLREREGRKGRRELARRNGVRPTMPERWAELLRRYGRWGEYYTWELDFSVISGNGLSRLRDFEGAREVLREGIARNRKPERLADLYQGLANAHYYGGYKLQKDGLAVYDLPAVSRAARAYEKSLENQPRALSYGNLGWMYFLLGDYRKAEDYSRRALLRNERMHYVRLNLGLIHLAQGRLRDSFEAYYTVMQMNPPSDVYLGGINDLREVLRDNPGRYPFAYLVVGALAVKKGDLTTARDALSRFVAGPSPGPVWLRLGKALLRNLDVAELER